MNRENMCVEIHFIPKCLTTLVTFDSANSCMLGHMAA